MAGCELGILFRRRLEPELPRPLVSARCFSVLVIFGHEGCVCVYIYYLAFLLCLQSYEIQLGRNGLLRDYIAFSASSFRRRSFTLYFLFHLKPQ